MPGVERMGARPRIPEGVYRAAASAEQERERADGAGDHQGGGDPDGGHEQPDRTRFGRLGDRLRVGIMLLERRLLAPQRGGGLLDLRYIARQLIGDDRGELLRRDRGWWSRVGVWAVGGAVDRWRACVSSVSCSSVCGADGREPRDHAPGVIPIRAISRAGVDGFGARHGAFPSNSAPPARRLTFRNLNARAIAGLRRASPAPVDVQAAGRPDAGVGCPRNPARATR